MWKERLKGALIIIFVEAIVFTAAGFYVYQNYIELTKERSITEVIPDQTISLENIEYKTESTLITGDNQYHFENMFGQVSAKKIAKGTSLHNFEKSSYEKIVINQEKIKKYCVLNAYLEDGTIDTYIYHYFLEKDLQEFNIFLNNLLKINKYLNIPIQEYNFDNKFCGIEQLNQHIREKKYVDVIRDLKEFDAKIQQNIKSQKYNKKLISLDFFDTMEFQYLINRFIIDEEQLYKEDVEKVAKLLDIDKNIINSAVLTEQVRGFFTYRGYVKDIVKSNKVLMVMSQFSYGIGGIKERTAENIENYLSGSNQELYSEYFSGVNNDAMRVELLTKDTFVQLLYTGGLIKSILDRWSAEGHDISKDYGVIFTLYNFGNAKKKKPHANPEMGGAVILINEKEYTFGALGMIFYYYLEFYY